MTDKTLVAYRRLITTIGRLLSAEEIEQIAFTRLSHLEDTTKYAPSKCTVTGTGLLAKLERLGVFSRQNVDGLIDIANDVNRNDLAEEVKRYKKNSTVQSVRYAKRKQRGVPSAELHMLEEAFEHMVVEMSVFEQQISMLQRTLDGEGDIWDEGAEILLQTSDIANRLAVELSDTHQKLVRDRRPRVTSSSSSGDFSRSVECTVESRNYGLNQECVIVPSQEKPRPPPKVRSRTIATVTPPGTPELARELRERMNSPSIPTPLASSSSSSEREQSEGLLLSDSRKYSRHPECERDKKYMSGAKKQPLLPPKRPKPRRIMAAQNEDDEDGTGDSGMGTGSGSNSCGGSVHAWRQAMKNPPPDVKHKHQKYQTLSTENRDEATYYTSVNHGRTFHS